MGSSSYLFTVYIEDFFGASTHRHAVIPRSGISIETRGSNLVAASAVAIAGVEVNRPCARQLNGQVVPAAAGLIISVPG